MRMYEIRFHGRGGQGAVLASKILAKALSEDGKFVKAIPSFGFERRGAPVSAFLRFDENTIRQTTNIYHPHCIICLDPTLPRSVNIFENLRDHGIWVQVSKRPVDELKFPASVGKIGLCDAYGIALGIFGKAITNTVMLGAFTKTTGVVTIDAVFKGMESVAFRDAALDKNIQAVRRGYEETKVFDPMGKEIS